MSPPGFVATILYLQIPIQTTFQWKLLYTLRKRGNGGSYLCRKGAIGIEEAIAILRDSKISNNGTVQSLLLIPQRLELWVARKTTPPVSEGDFIQLKDFFAE